MPEAEPGPSWMPAFAGMTGGVGNSFVIPAKAGIQARNVGPGFPLSRE
jgi:hypothetical protein